MVKNKYLLSPTGLQIGVEPNRARLKEGESTVASNLDNKQMAIITAGSALLFLIFIK